MWYLFPVIRFCIDAGLAAERKPAINDHYHWLFNGNDHYPAHQPFLSRGVNSQAKTQGIRAVLADQHQCVFFSRFIIFYILFK